MKEAHELIECLKEHKCKVAFAESVTCGLAAHLMNGYKGTSDVFMGSIVAYNEKVKTRLLSVSKTTLARCSAESPEVTHEMAAGLKKAVPADIFAAITGLAIAGGSENPEKPVGSIFVEVVSGEKANSYASVFNGTPDHIKKDACKFFFTSIVSFIKENENP